ncbi:MAG: C2H2-type zinc finger protein [Nitrososphaeraceae archaeon]
MFESLDAYIKFKDAYHIQKALEENIPAKKKQYQITDKTREQPVVRTHNTTTADKSIKEREAVNKYEERKDYPEVTPTAMSDFICSMCGKTFQNQDDLVHHRQFEREVREEEIEEGLKDREKGMNQQQQQPSIGKHQPIERVGDITGELPTNITTDKEIASKMANLLEGLEFPVTKEEIKDHINKKKKSKVMKNNKIIVDTVLQAIQNNLQERIQYNNVYEIEKAAKLVRKMNE